MKLPKRVGIPISLQKDDFRFIKVSSGKKVPLEKKWQKTRNYAWNDPSLQEHLDKGGNYGVACGYGGLVVVDSDADAVEKAVKENLPDSFTVRTGGGGQHSYYICKDLAGPIRLNEEKGGDLGDIQYTGKQVVGPNSIHPNGKKYEAENKRTIKEISARDLRSAFRDFLKDESAAVAREEDAALEKRGVGENIPIASVINLDKLKRSGDEFQGSHPIHGSTGGRNFCVNPRKGVWHCFRHGTGGGPLSWLAVKEGVINCSEAAPGTLEGRKFAEVLEKARREGLVSEQDETEKKWVTVAEGILSDHHIVTHEDSKVMYLYEGGVYEPRGEVACQARAQEELGKKASLHATNEIVNYVIRSTYTRPSEFDNPEHLLNLKNGLLDTRDGGVRQHSPDYISTTQLPVEYNPEADCPGWKKFLYEVIPEEQLQTVQDMAGCCLLKSYDYDSLFILLGDGANGKTTFLAVLGMLLGKENVSGETIQDLERNIYSKASLFGKLANLCGDLPQKKLLGTGTIKQLSGGDLIRAERKYQHAFTFENFATLIFSANRLPRNPDETFALQRRVIIIDFPNRFVDEPDPENPLEKEKRPREEILEELEKELPGILNWALTGMERILEALSKAEIVERGQKKLGGGKIYNIVRPGGRPFQADGDKGKEAIPEFEKKRSRRSSSGAARRR